LADEGIIAASTSRKAGSVAGPRLRANLITTGRPLGERNVARLRKQIGNGHPLIDGDS